MFQESLFLSVHGSVSVWTQIRAPQRPVSTEGRAPTAAPPTRAPARRSSAIATVRHSVCLSSPKQILAKSTTRQYTLGASASRPA